MLRSRLHFYLLFLFTLVLGLSACSSPADGLPGPAVTTTATQALSSSTPSDTVRHTIGEQVPVGSWVITIKTYSSSGDNSYTPKDGYALLIFNIDQQNNGNQSITANGATDWKLRDNSGATFPLITKSGYGTFPSQSVDAGETATGTLVYEVPTSTQSFLLNFDEASSHHQASWNVSLG